MSTVGRNLPPKPAPKPGQVKVVRALYSYTAQCPDELSFEEGDTLYVVDQSSDPNWWKAKCGDRVGLIPSNYVEGGGAESVEHPLHEACRRGNLSFLREGLANGVSPNGLDRAGNTPLHWAARAGHLDCMEEMLAQPNIHLQVQNKVGDTPLHLSAWRGHSEIVRVLLERGARCDLNNQQKQKPLDLAKDPDSASLLLKASSARGFGHRHDSQTRPAPEDYGADDDSD